jgi:hypothetical protein
MSLVSYRRCIINTGKDTADRLSFGRKERLRAVIAVSVDEIARTVVRTQESVLSLVQAPVLYLEELMTDNKVSIL